MGLTQRLKRKMLSILVIMIMTVAMLPSIAFAASPSDISNHWAKVQIEDWMDKGLVNGYPDGTFRPDNNITRAEFMVLVNGAFGYSVKVSIDYVDVTANDWYFDAVAKAKAAGYITGYADGTVKPNNPISREEAAVVIMKVKKLVQNETAADKFTDASSISEWSKGGIGAAVANGIMSGYPDGTFQASNSITRAEAVVALSKALVNTTPETAAVTYDKAGTYGPATGTETVIGNVIIKAPDITLQNTVIEGNLIIDKAVGEGNVTLKRVIVKGNTYIYGGGTNSVYFIDTQTGKTYVLKDSGPVRIVVSGTSEVNQLIAQSSVKVEEVDLTGKGFEGIVADRQVDGTITVNISGLNVESIEVNSTNTVIVTDRNTNISSLVANASVAVKGAGTIEEATINASGVTYDTKFSSQTVASGVSAPVQTSSGGGGGGSSTLGLSGVGIDVAAGIITGTATTMQYSLDSTTGSDGTWADCTATNTAVTFAAGDVYVRAKAQIANYRLVATIASAAGAPTLGFDDVANIITGLDATYEYKIDAGEWTAGTVVGDFSGTKTVLVRVKATTSAFPSANQTINFTTNLDLSGVGIDVAAGNVTGTATTMQYSLDSTTGSDGTWTDCTATNTAVTFAEGKVYVRAKAQTANYRLAATIASAAEAPTSLVTYDVAAGTVTGLAATYECSLNGGAWSTTASGVNFVAGDVTVRTKATVSVLPSAAQTIGTVAAAAGAPTLVYDDVANTITGLDATYEYNINAGAWTAGTVVGDFSGTKTVLVRVKSTPSALPSANQTINFTTNVDLSGVGINVAAGNVTGTASTMQYSLDSTTGIDGTWTDCTATDTAVTFVEGKIYVRAKTQTGNYRLVATIASTAGAPTLVFDDVANTITGLDVTYEYNINAGAWTAGTVVGDFSGTKTVLVRVKSTPSALPSANQTINFTTNVDLSGVGINVAAGNVTGTASTMQYSLDSTTGIDGTWTDCTATDTAVTFVEGKIYVRAKTQTANYRLVATIAAAAGAPTLVYDDLANTITGLGAAYEYNINAGVWTAGTVIGDFSGTKTVLVRVKATPSVLPSANQTINFTTNLDLSGVGIDVAAGNVTGTATTMQYSLDSTTGSDGTWTDCTDINTAAIFAEGKVYVRAKAQTANHRLVATIAAAAGAPTLVFDDVANTIIGLGAAYEYNINAGVWIAGTVVGDFSGTNTVVVRVKATTSAFPSANQTINFTTNLDLSGAGIDVAAGNITGTAITMQYSLNSTTGSNGTWADCTATNTAVTFAAGKVHVRAKDQIANYRLVATIAAVAGAPTLVFDDVADTITGLDATCEYNINAGAWTAGTVVGDFSGTKTVLVRVKAITSALPSANQTINFTPNLDLSGAGIDVAAGNITGTAITMQYSLNSTTGSNGTWADCTATNTAVTFAEGKVYVRAKDQIANYRLAATIAAAAGAPTSLVTYDVAAGTVSGLAATYEYSINGGVWSTTASGVNFVAGDVTVRTKATVSALPSAAQTIGTIAAAAGAPTLGFDDEANTITGLDAAYEYKIEAGEWTVGTVVGDFSGTKTVLVRVKATTSTLPSANQTISFTINVDLSGVGINIATGKITGTATTMQYSLDSTTGIDGTWTDCTATDTAVTFVEGKVYVRAKAYTANYRLVDTISAPETITSKAISNFDFATIQASGAKIVSKTILSSDFSINNKSFTITDVNGDVIPVDLWWNVGMNEFTPTYASAVGSAIESSIQDYEYAKYGADGLMNRPLFASYEGDTLYISSFDNGASQVIQLGGLDWEFFFNSPSAQGTDLNTTANRKFTVFDGTKTANVNLTTKYIDMTAMATWLNNRLKSAGVKAAIQKVDDNHFKIIGSPGIHLTIGGSNPAEFFN